MAPRELPDVEAEQLSSWPVEMTHSDLVRFVDLRLADLRWPRTRRGDANKLGMAVQMCALRHLGFVPDDLAAAPPEVVAPVADRLGVNACVSTI